MSRPVSNAKKRKIAALLQQASQSFQSSDFKNCERLCKKIDRVIEGIPNVLNLRGSMAAVRGDLERAEQYFSRAAAKAPDQPEALENLARIHSMKGNTEQAAAAYQQVLRLQQPQNIATVLAYCSVLIELNEAQKAVDIMLPLLKTHPEHTGLLYMLATAYFNLRYFDKAKEHLTHFLALAPDHALGNRQMGLLQSQEGKMAEAEQSWRRCLAVTPDDMVAYANLVLIKKYRDPEDPDITAIKTIEQQSANDPVASSAASFALGKIYHDLEQPDIAFSYWKRGNRIRRESTPYNNEIELQHMQEVMTAYTPEVFAQAGGMPGVRPIFIVGMPRSGTTLTEQILASHHDVCARGECGAMEGEALARCHSKHNPLTLERIIHFTPQEWQQVAHWYLEAVAPDGHEPHTTDKTLENIRLVGAIHCAFPDAIIIHVRRHPLDTCLSIFRNNLAGKLLAFGSDLNELAHYYAKYQEIMQHWQNILPEGVMLEVNYEDIVRDQEGQTRRMLEFCGLEWDENCLRFYTNKNSVETASVAQVRRPMYKDSIAAWQRYEKHLQPLIDVLGTDNPWISEGRGRQV